MCPSLFPTLSRQRTRERCELALETYLLPVLLAIPANPMTLGKTLSLHAGAHSACASEPLYSEAPGDRGELLDDGEHPARTTSPAVSPGTSPAQAASWSVGSLFCSFSPLSVLPQKY